MMDSDETKQARYNPEYFRTHSTGHDDYPNQHRSSIRRTRTRRFSLLLSTEEQHKTLEDLSFYGPYAHIRKTLDYDYHAHYEKERQWFQDSIIEDMLDNIQSKDVCTTPSEPWFVYTAGVQGAGKDYTIKTLVKRGCLPLLSYVHVDPDQIRRRLPEYASFVQKSPECVDALTKKESGFIAEILTLAALQAGRNVIMDGALMDSYWYNMFFDNIRTDYPCVKISLLYITAPRDLIITRAMNHARVTDRVLPQETIDRVLEQLPKSVEDVAPNVDYFCTILNSETLELVAGDEDWHSFQVNFLQTCSWQPGQAMGDLYKMTTEEGKRDAADAAFKAVTTKCRTQKRFSVFISSEMNHKSDVAAFFGPYSHIRATLDYTYHSHYTRERQNLQDAIISDTLKAAVITDVNGDVCTTPTEPWIVFTAGAMGAGKSYTMSKLVEMGRFPLLAFVSVDPDEIRRHLPEFHLYVDQSPETAGELTRKESGFIAEILTLAGLQAGKNVLVDGSLRDAEWYKEYFERLRKSFSNLRIAILHVTAPRDAVFQRAAERAMTTGRVVPRETLIMALEQVPRSVKILAPLADYFCELNNAPQVPDIELMTEGESWESFESQWLQTCAWVPRKRTLKDI